MAIKQDVARLCRDLREEEGKLMINGKKNNYERNYLS